MKSKFILGAFFLFTWLVAGFVFAAEDSPPPSDKTEEPIPWVRKVAFGLVLHDVGFISDQWEHGLDPNWEVQFNPPQWRWWRYIGTPMAILGATPNFNNGTSAFYLGLNWEVSLSNRFLDDLTADFSKRLWFAGGISTAVHTGRLRKNDFQCDVRNNCGFGSRVLPRISLELGANFWENHAVSLFFDHMSHGSLGCPCIQNEGLDHSGIRYHFKFYTGPKPSADKAASDKPSSS